MSIAIVFIVLFASFLAVSINYSRAFTVKNEIINIIENNQGWTQSSNRTYACTDTNTTECQILKYLSQVGYNIPSDGTVYCPEEYNRNGSPVEVNPGGYCIKLICTKTGTGRQNATNNAASGYYIVTTFVRVELPIIWTGLNVPVTGQTMTLYYNNSSGISCSNL
jgi:hypothetical protein